MEQTNIQLSQCMIVKNEEKNIEKALSWGKEIMCEQIVVDTGSTDRTVELAEKMGAKVFHFAWKNDFAAAKNYAIGLTKGEWIAFLDADESFPKEDLNKLMRFLKQANANPQIAFIRTKIVHLNWDGSVIAVSSQDRLFRKDPNIRYRYRIHEQLYKEGDPNVKYFDAQEDLMILHTGYGTQVNRPEKGERNAQLLKKELEDNPKSGMLLMYLGDAYDLANRIEDALGCYRKVVWDDSIDTSDGLSALRCGLQILRIRMHEPAEDRKDELFKISDKLQELGHGLHPDLDYFKGHWYLKAGEMEKAAVLFENALEKLEWYQNVEVARMTSDLELPNRVVALAALKKGELQKAVRFVVPALRINRYSEDSIKVLLASFRMEWKDGKSVEPYWDFLKQLYDIDSLKDLLILYKSAKEIPFDKLAEKIREFLPEEVKQQLKGSNHDK